MRNKNKFILIFIFSALGLFILSSFALSEKERQKKEELYRQVELFSNALTIVQSDYVDEPSPKDLIYGALKGMLSSLDPHSQFMDPEAYKELKIETEGKFGGIGIEITIKDGLLTVVTPIEDTPAWRAGIKANDRIVKIDNELTRDFTLSDAVKKMRGNPGTQVKLTVLRESEKKMLDFNIVRDIIKIRDVKEARILQDSIGYIRLVVFNENTPKEIRLALESLKKRGMKALILDLRSNPGGLLDTAVKVAECFIEPGKLIVYTKGRQDDQNIEFRSRSKRPLIDLPMVVLINEGSASGSEIVAGCFQDYKRAIVVGVKSFGKGSVQSVIPLSDGSALRLTTSKYYTPSGKEIHGKGIEPDITVEAARVEVAAKDNNKPVDPNLVFDEMEKKESEKEADSLSYQKDNQLMYAIGVLKAVMFYSGKEDK